MLHPLSRTGWYKLPTEGCQPWRRGIATRNPVSPVSTGNDDPGVGPRIAALIDRVAGPRKIDLCLKLPTGLVDRRFTPSVAEAPEGRIATFTLLVEVHLPAPPRTRLPYKVRCRDETGAIDLVFFNARSDYLASALPVGETRVVSGLVEWYRSTPQIAHPDVIERPERWTPSMAVEPVYPSTQGLGPRIYRRAVASALDAAAKLPEWQSPSVLAREAWPGWRGRAAWRASARGWLVRAAGASHAPAPRI